MIPVSLRLKGSIGIYLGMGIDEIIIDFTQFKQGIIAFVGDNGIGKSTTMEMMHPYPQLASREGKLQDHFRLRDSEKEFICTQNGILYTTKLLIDCQSGRIEGYIYEGQEKRPLNDGKISTYKEQVEKVFGSAETFFNAIFSAQQSKSIVALKPSKRKEIFYDFMGDTLNKFSAMDEIAKEKLDETTAELNTIDGKISVIQGQIDALPTLEEVEEKRKELRIAVNICQLTQETKNKELAQNTEDIALTQHGIKNADQSQHELLECYGRKSEIEKKQREETQRNAEAVSQLNRQIQEVKDSITRAEKITANAKTIDEALARESELEQKLAKLNELKAQKSELEKKVSEREAEYQKELVTYNQSVNDIAQQFHDRIQQATKEYQERQNKAQRERDNLFVTVTDLATNLHREQIAISQRNAKNVQELANLSYKLEQLKKSAELIDTVPCRDNQEYVSTCQLLQGAVNAREEAKTIAQQEQEAKARLEDDKNKGAEAIAELTEKHATAKKTLDSFAFPSYEECQLQIVDIKAEQVQAVAKVQKPAQPDQQEAKKEIAELESKIAEEPAIRKAIDDSKKVDWNGLKKELEQAETLLPIKRDQLASLQKSLEQESNTSNETLQRLFSESTEIAGKITKLLAQSDKSALEAKLATLQQKKQDLERVLEQTNTDRQQCEAELVQVEGVEKQRAGYNKQLQEQDEKRQTVTQKIVRLTFIREGLSKNGIPALIIDLAGIEITKIANDLLSNTFDTQFNVSFETTKQTKDGNTVETFDIKVERAGYGEVLIENLSGGERVWVDNAITNAFGIYGSQQSQRENLTTFSDEKDGALSPEKKQIFLKLTQETFKLGNRHFLFMVTHTPEVWKQITQRVHFYRDGKTVIVN